MAAKKVQDETKLEHALVPVHEKLSKKDKDEVLKRYNITMTELPKILMTDPGIRHLDPKPGDIIRIKRSSMSSGESVFFRAVVEN